MTSGNVSNCVSDTLPGAPTRQMVLNPNVARHSRGDSSVSRTKAGTISLLESLKLALPVSLP